MGTSSRDPTASSGQSLVEVIVVMSVGAMVILALSLLVVNSLKNNRFVQNQALATKYAQDGLEKVRTIRDRDGSVAYTYTTNSCIPGSGTTSRFSDLWCINMSVNCPNSLCFVTISGNSSLQQSTSFDFETLPDGLKRQVIFEDVLAADRFKTEKKITVKVFWTDTNGTHESNLQTLLVVK